MIKTFYLILLFVISFEQTPSIPNTNEPISNTNYIYLPMKKDHKFGDDICYYREYDDKLNYYIFYVKPCEKGKFCQSQITAQPFGYCIDLLTEPATLSKWKESCESINDCQSNLICENSKCIYGLCSNEEDAYQKDKINFDCLGNNEKIDDNFCEKYEYTNDPTTNRPSLTYKYYGNYPGLPNVCGLSKYKPFNYKHSTGSELVDDVLYRIESKGWCTIGSVSDNEFVDNEKYCYSGFALDFYPNKLYNEPSKYDLSSNRMKKLCVTPISVDVNNELANGCIITYKISEQSPKQYKMGSSPCSHTLVIESERYRDYIDAFKEANDEDKKNCYDIDNYPYHCKNEKLIKLWYFYKYPEDYLFYKDRDKLKTVLDFKIQRKYPTYAFNQYLNYSYFLFLLFLIIM